MSDPQSTRLTGTPTQDGLPALLIGGVDLQVPGAGSPLAVALNVIHPDGTVVWAYGLRTPREMTIAKLYPAFEVGRDAQRIVANLAASHDTLNPETELVEFWLIDRDGRRSNVLRLPEVAA